MIGVEDAARAAADRVIADLEEILEGREELGREVRQRIRALAEHSTQLAILSFAGSEVVGAEDLEALRSTLDARMKTLEATVSVGVAKGVREATRKVIFGTLEIALAAVL